MSFLSPVKYVTSPMTYKKNMNDILRYTSANLKSFFFLLHVDVPPTRLQRKFKLSPKGIVNSPVNPV